ncbi:MAG: Slp family lipoprotein [Aquimonas sp.]|nr:Slp family lipoprotein [Xanthomonadales bacterium]MCC6505452.1 Slp family lipoprotein [Aquimonas sp.]
MCSRAFRWIAVLCTAFVAGCASAPKALQGQFADLSADLARQQDALHREVRWGGEIIAVEADEQQTCFVVLSRSLLPTARPVTKREESLGRFIACRQGFYDPALFSEGRDVTIAGQIDGYESRLISNFDYRYPRVAAEVIHLWPERRPLDARHVPPMGMYWRYDPFWRW